MESLRDSETTGDLSPLAWVQEELRRALEAANKAVRRFVRDADAVQGVDTDAVDPSVLNAARHQLHQAAGALRMVGEQAGATMVEAAEAAVQRLGSQPQKLRPGFVEILERASFALLEYIGRRLYGRPVSPVAMFPQYRALQTLAGAERIHPADLWNEAWTWRSLPIEDGLASRTVDAESRTELELALLELMRRTQPQTAARLSDLFASLGVDARDPEVAILWRLAAGFYQAQAQELLAADNYSKRVGSRLLACLRSVERGVAPADVERLAKDLLFFCAQCDSPGDGRQAPRLAAVRLEYGLTHHQPVRYEQSRLGRFDPAWISQARKRVAAAKDAWSSVAGGEMHRMAGLNEQFALVADSLRRLYPSGDMLADELSLAIGHTVSQGAAPVTELAMEVATSVLYIEASLEDGDLDDPQLGFRVQRLAARIAAVRMGSPSEPLEAWMEDLYRRVSDRQTMGSVVGELRASLGEAERHIDQYFRNPTDRSALIPVPGQLMTMRGVLSVLGLDQASAAVLRMRAEVEDLVSTEIDPERARYSAIFERLAGNLGALGFLIDMLGVQPQLAKSLFAFDAEAGVFGPVMGRTTAPTWTGSELPGVVMPPEPRLIEQAQALAASATSEDVPAQDVVRELDRLAQEEGIADQPALAASIAQAQAALEHARDPVDQTLAREHLAQSITDFVNTSSEAAEMMPAAVAPTPVASGLEDDDEMREVFLEEAREVVAGAREALAELHRHPDDLGQLTTVRRAFHTLKGSSRMVGLSDLGEAAWSCEQLYNTRLAEVPRADEALLGFSGEAFDYLADWVDEIAARATPRHTSTPVRQAADAFRLRGERLPLAVPAAAAVIDTASLVVPTTPVAADAMMPTAEALPEVEAFDESLPTFDLGDFEPLDPLPAVAVEAPPVQPAALDFSLDLSALDEAPAPLSASPQPFGFEGLELDADAAAGAATDFSFELDIEEPQATEPMPLPLEVDELPMPEVRLETIELDLGTLDAPVDAEPSELPAIEDAAPIEAPEFDEAPAPPVVEGVTDVEAGAAPAAEVWPSFEIAAGDAAEADVAPAVEDEAVPDELDVAAALAAAAAADEAEHVKVVGPLRIGIPLFNIYLNEADELSRRLAVELAEWSLELHRPVGETAIALAHSLAGSSATVGFADLSSLARALEHGLMRTHAIGAGTPEEGVLFTEVSDEIRGLLHQFAAGFLKEPPSTLLERLAEHEITSATRLEAAQDAADTATPDEVAEAAVPASSRAAPLDALDAPDSAPGDLEKTVVFGSLPSLAGAEELADESTELFELPLGAPIVEPEPEPPPSFEPAIESAAFGEAMLSAPMPLTSEEASTLGRSELKSLSALPLELPAHAAAPDAIDGDDDIDAVDSLDPDLFPIFDEEAQELLPQLSSRLHDWAARPTDPSGPAACMRTLHTLKGGARLAGAMRMGELAHRLETAIEHLSSHEQIESSEIEPLQVRADQLAAVLDELRGHTQQPDAATPVPEVTMAPVAPEATPLPESVLTAFHTAPLAEPDDVLPSAPAPLAPPPQVESVVPASPPSLDPTATPRTELPEIDWSRFAGRALQAAGPERRATPVNQSVVRVRAPLLERLVNHAGEVSITRSRIEVEVAQIKSSLSDLSENLDRLRGQLRDIELQAETQVASRMEAAKQASETFDPLEFDRFTRFQELTRMMAESVNDVATVQRTLQRTLEATEDDLAAQSRLTRELQDDLLRTRMVEFESIADRLYRVVRQAAKETGKQVRLDIVGGSIEVDRGVLDRMTGSFEHLLRNCVTHGIELPAVRQGLGKEATGTIIVSLTQEGNEVGVEFRDDGQGLNLLRIRDRGIAMGLIDPQGSYSDQALANLIYTPGFSTADSVTELAGRGIGLDVVRSDVNAMGGRIETATAWGQGTSFRLVLPLTTAVTQVVMLRCGATTIAVPATLVELVRRETFENVALSYEAGVYEYEGARLPFFWMGALLELGVPAVEGGRSTPVLIVRSAQQRIVVHVDEVLGSQEVVVKNLGPQLSRLPGLAGMTLLANGSPTLIYNPVALATLYGDRARLLVQSSRGDSATAHSTPVLPETLEPLVLVVDDSLTVRRVTQRLLRREGFRVALAKDGLEALERLSEERPQVVLSDIEMPRMDGFDLVRNLRGDTRWRDLPVIMITSRIAQKHRDHAAELGVDHYLGKPYSEEDLMALIRSYVGADILI